MLFVLAGNEIVKKNAVQCSVGKTVWNSVWANTKAGNELNQQLFDCIGKLFHSFHGKKFLELGAGRGVDAVALAEKNASVFALDFSPEAVKLIKRNLRSADKKTRLFSVVLGDLVVLPFSSDSFDLVYSQGTLEHLGDLGKAILESRRVLKKKGFLLIDVPQKFSLYSLVKKLLLKRNKWDVGWETEYSLFDLKKVLARNGFVFCCAYGSGFYPYFHKIGEGIIGRAIMPKFFQNRYMRIIKIVENSFIGPFVCESIGVVGIKE